MAQGIEWPVKTREIYNVVFDSSVVNDFTFRSDDIIVATWAKSGTTWTQQIIAQLLFAGEEGLPVADMSPWLDLRVPPKEEKLQAVEAQTHRRFIKTHLPVDALVYSPDAKYIFVGRDGRGNAASKEILPRKRIFRPHAPGRPPSRPTTNVSGYSSLSAVAGHF